MQLTLSNYDGQIVPSTIFTLGTAKQNTSFSGTAFCRIEDSASVFFYAPDHVLPLILERNFVAFVHTTYDRLQPDMSFQVYQDGLNPFPSRPIQAIHFLLQCCQGKTDQIDFNIHEYMTGWGRQFGEEGYEALRYFCETTSIEPVDLNSLSLEQLLAHKVDIGNTFLMQRFLEGDEERYFFEILSLQPTECDNPRTIFEAIKKYIYTGPTDFEQEILWMVIKSLRNGGIISPDHSHICINWIDEVSDFSFREAFAIIASSTFEETCLTRVEGVKKTLERELSQPATDCLEKMTCSLYDSSLLCPSFSALSFSEQESIILILIRIGREKPRKRELREQIIGDFFVSHKNSPHVPHFQILLWMWENSEENATLKSYLKRISVDDFVRIFDEPCSDRKKKLLMSICKHQLVKIFQSVENGDMRYGRIIHFMMNGGRQTDIFSLFMGMSNFVLRDKTAGSNQMGLLLQPKIKGWITTVRDRVHDALVFLVGNGRYQKTLLRSVKQGEELRESLLSIFADGYYPIGGKIHFSSPLDDHQVDLLHQTVGFGQTAFQLIHSDRSLNLPPCQSPLQLMQILTRLAEIGIVTDHQLQLQLSVAGRVPNQLAGVSGSVCLFSKIQPIEYHREAFVTNQNQFTGSCIMCYDAGVLTTTGFPNLPEKIIGRTDMLGFTHIIEVLTYYIVGNLISHHFHRGPFESIGTDFMRDYHALLESYGMTSILQKKWVHTPGETHTPEEEEEHYQVVKSCTDVLSADCQNYTKNGDASGLSFHVKRLLYTYIVRHRLLPLEESWAQNYLKYLNYVTFVPLEDTSSVAGTTLHG